MGRRKNQVDIGQDNGWLTAHCRPCNHVFASKIVGRWLFLEIWQGLYAWRSWQIHLDAIEKTTNRSGSGNIYRYVLRNFWFKKNNTHLILFWGNPWKYCRVFWNISTAVGSHIHSLEIDKVYYSIFLWIQLDTMELKK